MTDTLGSVTYTEYDALNRAARTWQNYLPGYPQNYQNTYNRVTAYGYDAVGNQVLVTDTLGNVTYTGYDALNRPVTVTTNYVDGLYDPNFPAEDLNRVTTYDTAGRVLTTRDHAARLTYHEYDAFGRPVTVTTNYVDGLYDPARPDEDVKQVTVYDAVTGWVTARWQIADTTIPTWYEYDVLGRLVTTTNALSGTTVTQYDALGRRSASIDAAGNTTHYGYDGAGRLVTTTNALDGAAVTIYDALGRRVAQTNPLGHTTVYTYDSAGRLSAQADPLGHVTTYSYDALGRRSAQTDADGVSLYSTYDAAGRLSSTCTALGHCVAYTYDALGRRVAQTDARGITTAYEYDALGRLIAVVENETTTGLSDYQTNVRTTYTYDLLGNMTVVENALGHTTVYTYDDLGRRIAEADALGHVTTYVYDGHGRRLAAVYPDADGPFTVTAAYNALGWTEAVVYPGVGDAPGFTVNYGYTPLGHRAAVTDATGALTYDYDTLYRPQHIDAPTGDVAYTYDAAGQRTHLIYPTGQTVTYTHDAAGRLTQVLDWSGGTTVYTYTDAGRLSGMARPNGVTSAYSYDSAGRLAQIEHRDLAAYLLARYTYTLDGVGNRTHITETVSGATRDIGYTYDPLNRLTAAAYSTGESYGYQYDAVGNRTVMTDAAGIYTYAYDAANRLTGIQLPDSSIQTYTWDARGNLIHDGTFTYTYNAAGRMVRAASVTATVVYTYNADGLRIAQADVAYAGAQTYVWDWASAVPELLADWRYTYLIGHDTLGWEGARSPMAPVMWTYVLPDALGSVRQETDAAGVVTAVREWSPYGVELGEAQAGLGYTGEWFDTGVGLQYLRARWYDGATGRFTQRDAVMQTAMYRYASNNPVNRLDPSGYLDWAACIIHGEMGTCMVQPGDSIYSIAREIRPEAIDTELTPLVADILALNPFVQSHPNFYLYPGDQLTLRADWITALQTPLGTPTPDAIVIIIEPVAPLLPLPPGVLKTSCTTGCDKGTMPVRTPQWRDSVSAFGEILGSPPVDHIDQLFETWAGKDLIPEGYGWYDLVAQLAQDANMDTCFFNRLARAEVVVFEQMVVAGTSVFVADKCGMGLGALTAGATGGNLGAFGAGYIVGWAAGYYGSYHIMLIGVDYANEQWIFPFLEDRLCEK